MPVACCLFAGSLGSGSAHAQSTYPVTITAALPGETSSIDSAILIGATGQIYHRGDDGTWRRRSAGGLSTHLRGVVRAPNGTLVAAGASSPVFRFEGGAWHARPLPNRGDLGAPAPGSAPVLSVGRSVYALDKAGRWQRLMNGPRPMAHVWATGATRIWAADAQGGLYRSTGGGFTPVRPSPALAAGDTIAAFAGTAEAELYALTSAGVLLALRPGSATAVAIPAELAGLRIDAIGPAPSGIVIAATIADDAGGAGRPVLLRAAKGKLTLDGDRPALPAGQRAAAVLGDAAGGVLIAGAAGHLLLRRGTDPWIQSTASGALPAAAARSFPGALPARSR